MQSTRAAIQQAAALIHDAQYVVALTGAGISTPSGIPDFRSPESGLWVRHDPFVVASIMGFKTAPQDFYEWVAPLARTMLEAKPNPAHEALARLEAMGKLKSIITQNIDMLHTRAGSKTVYEVHGHLREATCIKCYRSYPGEPLIREFLEADEVEVLRCVECGGVLKPNVILFGEQLPFDAMNASEQDARRCDIMIAAGSSLEVYPVANLPRTALASGAKLILINFEPTSYDRKADIVIHAEVAEVLPQIVQAVEKSL